MCGYKTAFLPIPVAARSKAARLLGLRVRISTEALLSLVSVECCQVGVSASGCSLAQRSPTECGEYECDRVASRTSRPWPTRGCCAMRRGETVFRHVRINSEELCSFIVSFHLSACISADPTGLFS